MKPHEIIAPWKGDTRFTAIAGRAAALKKAGRDREAILAAITAEFGPPARLERMRDTPAPYRVFGTVGTPDADIEPGALAQMETALRLPIAVRGALLPDAHQGYALPIGGVFAAHRAVAPAMVGVDIGCRMHCTILDIEPDAAYAERARLFDTLKRVTTFGAGAPRRYRADHPILDDPRWRLTAQLRGLRAKAEAQLGTSGGGNHFAELVIGERLRADLPGIPERFCALLTHSGSRGVGFAVANHYMRLAARETARRAHVPKMYEWLDIDSEAGQEYLAAMELCGDFARANHEVIHALFTRHAGLGVRTVVQNHHNFAWRVGDLVIHRKGATPAAAGELGIIPGSMASASYIVVGLGAPESLESSSHGAGRRGSRTWARNTISLREVRALLAERDVLAEGLAADEAPQAYKDIERVVRLQEEAGLIARVARLRPIAVLMAGEPGED
jgi:tRNA-splicing ligase RtcB